MSFRENTFFPHWRGKLSLWNSKNLRYTTLLTGTRLHLRTSFSAKERVRRTVSDDHSDTKQFHGSGMLGGPLQGEDLQFCWLIPSTFLFVISPRKKHVAKRILSVFAMLLYKEVLPCVMVTFWLKDDLLPLTYTACNCGIILKICIVV